MTIMSILVLCGIVSAFLVFGVALAWADFYSSRPPSKGAGVAESQVKEVPLRKAA